MHISWMSFATRDPVARVVEFYEKDQGAKADARSPGAFVLHARAHDNEIVEVRTADSSGYPSCSQKPAKGEQTVIILSSATR
jgi:hypothetical protein